MKHFSLLFFLTAALAPGLALAQHAHGAHAGHAPTVAHDGHAGDAKPPEHSGHSGHAAHAGHAAHDMHSAPSPALPAGQPAWTPDAPLVAGMARVRSAVATLAHLEMGHLGEPQVLTVAGDIDAAIEYMFANCSLEPEPDVALHGILARLMAASTALREAPADPAPVATMRAALADYGRVFDDPAAAAQR